MISNLKEIEKTINIRGNTKDYPPEGSGRINNPIAAAFAHKLANFVKTQTVLPSANRLDADY
jgi:hypothetical protein